MIIKSFCYTFLLVILLGKTALAQQSHNFTKADTLRGSVTPERSWWNVLRYDLTIQPDYETKTIRGVNRITFKTVSPNSRVRMQIDLKDSLQIDSVLIKKAGKIPFKKEGSVWYLNVPEQKINTTSVIDIYYAGNVHEAKRAPWDGGWTFTKDSLGRPWMTVTCQGAAGASIWYPCKDYQGDEPDNGASLTMRVPDTLVAVSNGKLTSTTKPGDGTTSYRWEVVNPINNYNLIPYIGKYVHFSGKYNGEKGALNLDYWVLDYNEIKAKSYLPSEVENMLKSFEYWFGPYPFYEDGYKLVDVPHTGMEHQSAVAYGNQYKPGYRGKDGSGTGWGLKWDFIVVHESGHEWFGNNITSNDLADMWIHEGFTNYSETLFVDYIFGRPAGDAYNAGTRRAIRNDRPVIPEYNVNSQGSGDMYPKSGNMLHAIRHSMDNDEKFRKILRGLNKQFYHQTVTTAQVENYVSKQAGFNYSAIFNQYLRTTQIPRFEFNINPKTQTISYRYTNCVKGFNLPLVLRNGSIKLRLLPTDTWSTIKLSGAQLALVSEKTIREMYYLETSVAAKK